MSSDLEAVFKPVACPLTGPIVNARTHAEQRSGATIAKRSAASIEQRLPSAPLAPSALSALDSPKSKTAAKRWWRGPKLYGLPCFNIVEWRAQQGGILVEPSFPQEVWAKTGPADKTDFPRAA